jgi:hypothetical protein
MLALTAPDESDSHGAMCCAEGCTSRTAQCASVSRGAVGHEAVDRDLRLVDVYGVIDVAERGQRARVRPLRQRGKHIGLLVKPTARASTEHISLIAHLSDMNGELVGNATLSQRRGWRDRRNREGPRRSRCRRSPGPDRGEARRPGARAHGAPDAEARDHRLGRPGERGPASPTLTCSRAAAGGV